MRLVLFDFDGVLADTLADMLRFAQETCDELEVPHIVRPADLSDLEVMSFATFGQACEVQVDRVEEFVRICTRKFAAKPTPPELFAGLKTVIRKLSEGNILVIVTGNTVANVNAFLVHHELQDCFRTVYGVDMPGSKVEKILTAKQHFETGNDAIFFIGDSLSDIRAAQAARVTSVAVSWGHQRMDMLIGGKPDVIIHSPAELLDVVHTST